MRTKLKETLQGVVAIAVLVALFWTVKQHSFAGLAASDSRDNAADLASNSNRVEPGMSSDADGTLHLEDQSIPSDVMTLPACADLAGALRQLHEARTRLLEATSKPNADAPTGPQDRYREAISTVRVELSKVHDLLAPDEYQVVCQELIAATLPDDTGSAYSWELGGLVEGLKL